METVSATSGNVETRSSRALALAAALLVLAVLIAFGPALRNELVYDDHHLVERNPVVRTLDPATHLGSEFWSRRDTAVPYYRPAVTASLALNWALHGPAPLGYHLVNLALHALSALLLLLVVRRFAGDSTAILAATIFALHPVQTESVVWVMGRTDLLATLFLLLAVWLHGRIPDGPVQRGLPRLGLAATAFAAALLSKEIAVVFPALVVGADLAAARASGADWRASVRAVATRTLRLMPFYAFVLVAYLLLRVAVVGSLLGGGDDAAADDALHPLQAAPVATRLMTSVHIAGRCLLLIVFPRTLSVDYMYDVVPLVRTAASWSFLAPLLACAAAIALTVSLALRRPAALFGGLAALSGYLLTSHLLIAGPVVMAERLLYLSMAGVAAVGAALAIHLVDRLAPENRRRIALVALGLILAAGFGARSFVRSGEWRDDFTLFSSAVRATPRSVQSWHNLAFEHSRRGDREAALDAYGRALAIDPDYLPSRLNRAATLRKLGRPDEAESEARGIVADHPGSGSARLELVRALAERADLLGSDAPGAAPLRDEAIRIALESGAEHSGEPPGVRAVFLGSAGENLAKLGRLSEADEAFARAVTAADAELETGGAVEEAPHAVRAALFGSVAEFLSATGRLSEAASRYEEAARAAEQAGQEELSAAMLLGAAETYLTGGQAERSLTAFDRLLQRDPSSMRARHGRARARLAAGDPAGAETDLRALLDAGPGDRLAATIWTDLGNAAVDARDWSEAWNRFDRALQLDPANLEARYWRGLLGARNGRAEAAEADLLAALQAPLPDSAAAEAWLGLARIALDRGDRAEARRRLERCVELRPDHPGAEALRGSL